MHWALCKVAVQKCWGTALLFGLLVPIGDAAKLYAVDTSAGVYAVIQNRLCLLQNCNDKGAGNMHRLLVPVNL